MPPDITEEHQTKFFSIESLVLNFYRSHPQLVDHNVDKVFEAFQRHYEKALQGKTPPELKLNNDENNLYNLLETILSELFNEFKTNAY